MKIHLALDYVCEALAQIEKNIERGYDKNSIAFNYGFDSGARHHLEFVKFLLTE